MAWTKTKGQIWGDQVQDETSDWLEEQKFDYENPGTKKARLVLLRRGLKDSKLKTKIDRFYKEEWKRPATVREYRNLLRIGLLL